MCASTMKLHSTFRKCLTIINHKYRSFTFNKIGNANRQIHQPSYAFTPSNLQLINQPIGRLLEAAAAEDGEKTAFVVCHQNIRKSYSEFNEDVNNFAAGLLALGLKPGDRIGMWGPDTYQWVVTQFATAKAGMIMTTINPAYQANELEYCLNNVKCAAIITEEKFKSQDYFELLNRVSPDLTTNTETTLSLKKGTLSFDNVQESANKANLDALRKVSDSVQFDDAVNIQFTSGTTGKPKGAVLSHFNIANNALIVGNRMGFSQHKPITCLPVPLYHCFSCVVGVLTNVIYKGTTVIPAPRFDALASLQAIENEKCNIVYGTPTMYVDMIEHPSFKNFKYSNLINGAMSGANCPKELIRSVKKAFGLDDILIPYGTTETSPVCTLTAKSDPEEKKISTVGRPIDYIEVKIVDSENRIVPVNSRGEVCLRGHSTFLGYWDNQEKTNEALKADKWYYTGDFGEMDKNGYIHIVGRKKDMVIRGGENLYPREIEEFLLSHPAIADVHVTGVPDKRLGEELCAWVSLKTGVQLSDDDLKSYCKGKISHFKIPRYVIFTESFPKTVTGKVQKFRMREESIKLLKLE